MKLVNDSPYDTRVLRRIAVAVYRWLRKKEGRPLGRWSRVSIYVGIGSARTLVGIPDEQAIARIQLPRLTGDEWHHAARGITNGKALTSEGFARRVCWWLMRAYSSRSFSDEVDPKALRRLPEFVPLKIIKPKPPRDVVQERYRRVLELEKSWLRKQKLAATKVRQYRQRRRYYEKRLAGKES